MAKPVIKEGTINVSIKDVFKRYTLNFTDIINNNNKFYNLELIESNDSKFYLLTTYGRVGASGVKEYRLCSDKSDVEKEAETIIKAKNKKGYVEVKLLKSDVGSEIGKSKVEASAVSEDVANKLGFTIKEENKSVLHPAVQAVIKNWFGSIEQFVINTLDTSKCALGQLSLDQINKGRSLLLEARQLVSVGAKDFKSLNDISSKYYSNIPMNFGYRKLDADKLRFDNNDKLDAAFEILETLENAKDSEKVLTKKNAIDDQYKSLKTEMEWVDPSDPIYKWIDILFHKTRASNHSFLGKMKIHNIFKLARNSEYDLFMAIAANLAKQDQKRNELPSLLKPIWDSRIKENKEYEDLYEKANILPLFHGSRTPNFPKILSSRLMLPKPGFTVAGAMYSGGDGGLYFGHSSKAINYSSAAGSYWANGTDKKGYLFLSDVILGKQKIATGAYPYTLNKIKPCMSVWAKGGQSGVINDEYIVYTEQQNWLRYIIEFETKA